jgi:uncharacterized protein (TIGR02246 family)
MEDTGTEGLAMATRRSLIPLAVLAALLAILSPRPAVAQSAEDEVRSLVEQFVVSWKAGDGEGMAALVADGGVLIWPSGSGSSAVVNTMDFAEIRARRKPQTTYDLVEIHSIDVVDDQLAVAKVEIRWASGTYIDYYTLYRVDGDWKIVSKMWVTRRDGDT